MDHRATPGNSGNSGKMAEIKAYPVRVAGKISKAYNFTQPVVQIGWLN
jgi:hypothetical protein